MQPELLKKRVMMEMKMLCVDEMKMHANTSKKLLFLHTGASFLGSKPAKPLNSELPSKPFWFYIIGIRTLKSKQSLLMEMGGKATNAIPIISKIYCSSSQVVLAVRRRPRVITGGGFVVTDCSQKVLFKVDGCGVLGTKGDLMVRDGDGGSLLLIRRKGGMVQALSIHRQWKGYSFDYEGLQKLVFSLKEPKSCLARNNITIKTSIEHKRGNKNWDFEINGYFPNRDCRIVDSEGNIVAQVGVKKEIDELMGSKDLYHVLVKPGIDQAFVIGVIAVLDYIYEESTRC